MQLSAYLIVHNQVWQQLKYQMDMLQSKKLD
jgi:hypothetical protein